MPKFKVHVFETFRREYLTDAESSQDAANKVLKAIDSGEAFSVFGEWTGDYDPEVCVDPLNEDGSVDYKNSVYLVED